MSPDLAPGSTFAGHRIEGVAGRGGMGVVYRARHLALNQQRALKLVAPHLSEDSTFRRRFQRESRLAASIEHPNVIPIHHAGEEGGQLYVAMRYVRGTDLRQLIAGAGRLAPTQAVAIVAQVAAALDAAHARALVHRDVKPENVLLEGDDGGEHAYLTDFGISKLAGSSDSVTATGGFIGTVDYTAPEQIEGGPVDRRTDVYSLGCVLYHAVTGELPFPRDTQLAKLFAHANAQPPVASDVAPEVPKALDRVLLHAMAKDPDERYAAAGELGAAAFEAVGLEGQAATAQPMPAGPAMAHREPHDGRSDAGPAAAPTARLPTAAGPTSSRRRRLVGVAAALALAAAIAAAAAAGLLPGGGSGSDEPAPSEAPVTTGDPIRVGDAPTHVAVTDEAVWVPSRSDDSVSRIDPDRNRTVGRPIEVGDEPTGIAVDEAGDLWVANEADGTVSRVDTARGRTVAVVRVGRRPSDVAVGEGAVWVANEGDRTVSRIDPLRDRVVDEILVGNEPRGVAVGEGSVWVTNIDDDTVSKIDPDSNRTVGRPIEVGGRPGEVAVGEGAVWVANNFDGTITRLEPSSGQVSGGPIEVGSHPRGVAVGDGTVWIANAGDDTVSRIDPGADALVGQPVKVGTDPVDIASGGSGIWVANFGDSTAQRIGP